MLSKFFVVLSLASSIASADTIDTFAKGTLTTPAPSAGVSMPGGLPAIPSVSPPIPMQGTAVPGKDGASQVFDIVFIQGSGNVRKAYLVVDGKYGKIVSRNEVVQGWKVVQIGGILSTSAKVENERDY
ncbi:hypothetical protein [Chromobacterium phragmitis]|uniref:hypothetical protein n=1 Tax=Chromobacterium phragmitis TaxID=2202141 RepID=UPI0011AE24B4|nr:hypothetical protein [Chromobacterium phragmitis]